MGAADPVVLGLRTLGAISEALGAILEGLGAISEGFAPTRDPDPVNYEASGPDAATADD